MNTIKLTDAQLKLLQDTLFCYAEHVKIIPVVHSEVTALRNAIENQLKKDDTYADRELDYE